MRWLIPFLLMMQLHPYAQNRSIDLSIKILPELKNEFRDQKITVFGMGENKRDTVLAPPYTLTINCDTSRNVLIFLASEVEFPELGTYKYFNETKVVSVPSTDTVIKLDVVFPPDCFYNRNVNQKVCPLCKKKDEVIPILYGLQYAGEKADLPPFKYGEYEPAGCEISDCDPTWYCKRDNLKF